VARPQITVAVALLSLLTLAAMRHAVARSQHVIGGPPGLTSEARHADLTFDQSVSQPDRALVQREIALARPEARRLIGIVDGLVTVAVGSATNGGPDAIGLTQTTRDGYLVTLNLGGAWEGEGERGVQRLVLHELGHVVDFVLVKPELAGRLDALIPAGYGCQVGTSAPIGCAPREERFAETFAKWCTGDIGVNLPIGYKVAPPASLDDWGAQLVSGIDAP
jgi:hypothetical protein